MQKKTLSNNIIFIRCTSVYTSTMKKNATNIQESFQTVYCRPTVLGGFLDRLILYLP